MNNKVLRVIGICAGTALLGVGLSGCSSAEKAQDSFPADKVSAEFNAMQPSDGQQMMQSTELQQMRSQLQKALGTDIYPQAVWEAIAAKKILPTDFLAAANQLKVVKEELRNQPGYTDADILKDLKQWLLKAGVPDVKFSVDSLDFFRLQKYSSDSDYGYVPQQLAKRVNPKLTVAKQKDMKQQQALKINQLLTANMKMTVGQIAQGQYRSPEVLEPDLGAGVRLQGLASAQQALQTQMQQGMQPAK